MFKKTTMVGFSVLSILFSVAVVLPINSAEANTRYSELDTDLWDCYGCDSNCADYVCGC